MTRATEFRPARDEREVDAGFDLADRTFGPSYFEARARHVRRRAVERPIDPEDVVVALADGEMIGVVWILPRHVWLGSQRVPVGGISLVSVRADVRGRGIGLRVMETALERQRRRGDQASILFARRAVDGWYPRLGYVGIAAHAETTAVSGGDLGPERAGVAPFDAGAVATYARAYEESYRDLFMSFDRDASWWSGAAERFDLQVGADAFHSVVSDGATVGYLVARGGRLLEIAALGAHRAATMAAAERYLGGKRVVSSLPLGHWAARELRRREHTMTVRFSWDGGHMVRVLDPAFLGLMDPSRWRDVDLSDHAAARGALLEVAGVGEAPRPLWPDPPSWSPVDEL